MILSPAFRGSPKKATALRLLEGWKRGSDDVQRALKQESIAIIQLLLVVLECMRRI
jgi:hypothetical protein